MARFLNIEFSPLKISLKRRLQTLAVLIVWFDFFFLGPFSTMFMIWMLYSRFYLFSLSYFFWIIYDSDMPLKGSRLSMWYRRLPIWRYYADYFPITLHKTVDLNHNENYIFVCHPHGIMAVGAVLNFSSEGTQFSKLFPGITTRIATLNLGFWMPIHREHWMLTGMCSANKESIEWILSENGSGNAVVIVPGGALESLDAIPHTFVLRLRNRKGFVKLALKHGVSLVPVVSFGENELFSQVERHNESLIKRTQQKLTRILTFAPVLFYGRGNTFGFLPRRKPIHTIVGEPIRVPQIWNPSQEDVNKYHELYVRSLRELFYANCEKYAENPNIEIVIK